MLVLLLACGPDEYVRQRINAALPCNFDEECVDLGLHEGFGCPVVVNVGGAAEIQALLDDVDSTLDPDECDGAYGVSIHCIDHLCGLDYLPVDM